MDAVLCGFQLRNLGTKTLSVGEAFADLGDMLAEDPDLFLQDFLSLFGGMMGLLGRAELVELCGGTRVKVGDPLVAFREGSFKLLKCTPMGGLPIAELDF